MAWVCENFFGTEPNVQSAYSIETFSWDDAGDLLIKAYCPMPESYLRFTIYYLPPADAQYFRYSPPALSCNSA